MHIQLDNAFQQMLPLPSFVKVQYLLFLEGNYFIFCYCLDTTASCCPYRAFFNQKCIVTTFNLTQSNGRWIKIGDGAYFLINYNINKITIVVTYYSRISHVSPWKFFCTQSCVWRYVFFEFTLGFWVLSNFAYLEFSLELIMWAKWKLLTLPSMLRPTDNCIFHSKMWCCVKYWDHWSNNIFTESVGGIRSQWSAGCRPLIFAYMQTVVLMEVKCCFWGNVYWPAFSDFLLTWWWLSWQNYSLKDETLPTYKAFSTQQALGILPFPLKFGQAVKPCLSERQCHPSSPGPSTQELDTVSGTTSLQRGRRGQ